MEGYRWFREVKIQKWNLQPVGRSLSAVTSVLLQTHEPIQFDEHGVADRRI
jgi:hypothetical protein